MGRAWRTWSRLATICCITNRRAAARRRPRRVVTPPLYPHAWVGSALYVLVLLGVADSRQPRTGAAWMHSTPASSMPGWCATGQWWRAWTALTLHLDAAHIAANIGAGAWFGYLAGRLLGPGTAWALVVLGAGVANWLEALLAAADHRSVGASTAVFTALGLLAAYSWRERHLMTLRPAQRYGPLFAGVILLGWLGTSGEHTDVMAHLLGFAVGGTAGRRDRRRPRCSACGAGCLSGSAARWRWGCSRLAWALRIADQLHVALGTDGRTAAAAVTSTAPSQ